MNKITNPFLQQIISNIVQETADGRMTDMSWSVLNEAVQSKNPFKAGDKVKLAKDVLGRHAKSVPAHMGYSTDQFSWRDTLRKLEGKIGTIERLSAIGKHVNVDFDGHTIGIDYTDLEPVSGNGSLDSINEANKKKKKKTVKREAKQPVNPDDEEQQQSEVPTQEPDAPSQEPDQQDVPPQKASDQVSPEDSEAPAESPDVGQEDVEQAQADAVASKAELEKAKAEKDQAEKDLKDNSYVKLNSTGGVNFLLGKILDHAFKTDSIDGLAGEIVQKLKIQTPEDFQAFTEETAPYRVLAGMGELLTSIQTMATKKQDVKDLNESSQRRFRRTNTNQFIIT